MLVRLRRSAWMACLIAMFWPMLASGLESTSPVPSSGPLMVPLETCLEEVTKLELESQRLLKQQEEDFKRKLYEVAQKAGAEATRAMSVELAGVQAERDLARRELAKWRVGLVGASSVAVLAIVVAIIAAVR